MANLTGYKRDNQGAYIEKHPDANIEYGVDWTDYLNSGDNVATATVTIESITGDSAPLAFPTDAATDVIITGGAVVGIRLEGGTTGNVYNVDCKVVTANGDTDSRRFRIVIGEKHL
jgi:hypothetical protein